jgi:hypothetical protein
MKNARYVQVAPGLSANRKLARNGVRGNGEATHLYAKNWGTPGEQLKEIAW